MSPGPEAPPPLPEVDVIIATNRSGPFLREAIASVTAQTYERWNLIVVDDGSPDPGFVEQEVSRVRGALLVRHSPRGLPASRNAGIAEGRSPVVAFLDDDDIWHPSKLAQQVEALRSSPEAVGSYGGGTYMTQDGASAGWGWEATPATRREFLSGAAPLPRIVTLIVRRAAVREVGEFDPRWSLGEDIEFILRLVDGGELVCVPRPLVSYRRHEANMSSVSLLETRAVLEGIVAAHRARAADRGDADVVSMLDEHLDRLVERWSFESARVMADAVRRRDGRTLAAELRWAVARAPRSTARAVQIKLRSALASAVDSRRS